MTWKIPKCVEQFLLRDYAEFRCTHNDVSPPQEQIMVARLVLAQQIDFFGLTEYMDFRDFTKIQGNLFQAFVKLFIFFVLVVILFGYGLIYFIIKAPVDEKLKPLTIVAIFSLTEFYVPPTQVLMYYWQSENMVKLISNFMDTCKGLARPPREFYKSLTLKRIIFRAFYRYNALVCMLIHIWKGSSCSDKDLRFVCGIYVPLWLPIETNYFPVREMLQILEITLTYRLVMITVQQSIDAYILTELFEYKSRQLKKLMYNTSLSRVQNLKVVKQKLHDIVDYHQQLHECFGLIRDIICGIIAPGITVFIPTVATQTVYFMKDTNIACLQISLLTGFIFYFCFDSIQRITDLGEIIQEAAYGMDWYEMDKEMNKDYIIFLMKLQRPLKMKSILFIIEKPLFLSGLISLYIRSIQMWNINPLICHCQREFRKSSIYSPLHKYLSMFHIHEPSIPSEMELKIQQYIEGMLLSGYPEYSVSQKDIPIQEEKILVKLVLAQQVDFFLNGEEIDFEKVEPKLLHGFKKLFGFSFCFASLLTYGLVQFILKAPEDDSLKPQVIIAVFSLLQSFYLPAQLSVYFWQSGNMVKFVNQYMNTCRTISKIPREFYRSLAIKRNLFKYIIRYVSIWNLLVHFFKGSSCSDTDLRFACGLFLPLWYPVETNYFPVREILLLVFVVLAWKLIILAVHLSIDSYIIAKLFEYKCQSLIKLMQKTSLNRVQNLELVKRKFRYIVDCHHDLKLCFVLMRDALGGLTSPGMIFFIPTTACFSTAFAKDFNSAYLLESLLLAVLCYFCFYSWQKITDSGEIIQEAAYNMDWYDMDKAMNKEYLIFLMKLQQPHELQSVIFVLEKPMFLRMMRSVYSFFMLMYRMN